MFEEPEHSRATGMKLFRSHTGGRAHPSSMHIAVLSNQTAIEYNHEVISFHQIPRLSDPLAPSPGVRILRTSTSIPQAPAACGSTHARTTTRPSLLGMERVAQRRRLPVEVCQHPIGVREREIEDWVCCVLQETRHRADGEKTDDLT